MLTIRLQRTGKRNRPEFRMIITEKTAAAGKKFLEILGSYNPRTKVLTAKEDRLKYWLGQHVEVSPTAHNLLVTNKLVTTPKVKAFSVPKKAEPKVESTPAAPAPEAAPAESAS